MRLFTLFTTISTLIIPTIFAAPASPSTGSISIGTTGVMPSGRHIVVLNPETASTDVLGHISSIAGAKKEDVAYIYTSVLNGFAGTFDDTTLDALRTTPGVLSIVQDSVVTTSATQTNAPWGLNRISSKRRLGVAVDLNFTYHYDDRAGEGVDIYVIDTGVRTSHKDFEGRAEWSGVFGPYLPHDGNGHGTHCAGTAAGGQYGVAKKAKILAIKVLSDLGSGFTSDVIAGMDHAMKKAKASGKPSVVSMSLGGPKNDAMDTAARNLVGAGVHLVVAAGNDDQDASGYSPAGVAEAITVGATTIQDERASFSNFGSVVDVFAPGQNVISTWKGSNTATKSLSGTSMATPHVAGLAAYLISVNGNMKPTALQQSIRDLSLVGLLNPYTLPPGHTNMVINNRFVN